MYAGLRVRPRSRRLAKVELDAGIAASGTDWGLLRRRLADADVTVTGVIGMLRR